MKEKKGFTLFELMLVMMLILIITIVALPLILYAIKAVRINAFKNSAYSVLESVKYYVASTNFVEIPADGINISNLNLELKNNNFDGGFVKPLDDKEFEIIYLSKNNYCAMGTVKDMRATDKGCGALDETSPTKAYVYLKNTTKDSITIVASGVDSESKIIYYQFSIDGKKYTKKSEHNVYTFNNLKEGKHTVSVRVTNEADLTTDSEPVTFKTGENNKIECANEHTTNNFSPVKNITCTYPSGSDYIYEYSEDLINWNEIKLDENQYVFTFDKNKKISTRIRSNSKVIAQISIHINNIDATLNGVYPELLENMIPVIYNEQKKVWVKANDKTIYWDYDNKKWANAVLVRSSNDSNDSKSHNREYYLSNEAIGEEVYEKDIIGYYVWIPRYRYRLFNVSNKKMSPITIDIAFESIDTAKSRNVENEYFNDTWYTHQAFSYDNETNGFWVSKFQNSTSTNSNCYINKNKENCDRIDLYLYSLPNLDSITNISLGNASYIVKNMNIKANIYGLQDSSNPHIITNLEWGAIAYLTNSIYGINNNLTSISNDYKNNLTNSTTGNITGVFDMSSKNLEFVMGNYNQDSGKDKNNHSNFKNFGSIDWPNYIDYYKGITYKNRILGDAIGETINWYGSSSNFINGEYPFIIRGGTMNSISSIYNYDKSTGQASDNITIRTVLSKKETFE